MDDTDTDVLENPFDRNARNIEVLEQVLGIHPMFLDSIGRYGAGARGECDIGSYGCIDFGEALADRSRRRRVGIVSAGIENDDVDGRARALYSVEDTIEIDPFERDIVPALRIGIRRHQVVASTVLHAMAGKVDETHGRPLLELRSKIPEG